MLKISIGYKGGYLISLLDMLKISFESKGGYLVSLLDILKISGGGYLISHIELILDHPIKS